MEKGSPLPRAALQARTGSSAAARGTTVSARSAAAPRRRGRPHAGNTGSLLQTLTMRPSPNARTTVVKSTAAGGSTARSTAGGGGRPGASAGMTSAGANDTGPCKERRGGWSWKAGALDQRASRKPPRACRAGTTRPPE